MASARAARGAEVTNTLTRGDVKVRYRERHIGNAARAVDFTCTWLKGNRAKTTECFMHADPHKTAGCNYRNDNAPAQYKKLALDYAKWTCNTRTVKMGKGC